MHKLLFIFCLSIMLCATSVALAQADEPEPEAQATDPDASYTEAGEPLDLFETETEKSIAWFLGAHGRMNWVPPFFQQLFLDEAPAVFAPGFNLVVTHRLADGMSVVFGLGYISYAVEGPYRDKGDPDEDTEYIDGNLGLAKLTASLLWSSQLASWVAIEYGFGLDFGIVTGELRRTEAYPDSSTDNGWRPCSGPGYPLQYINYCQLGSVPYDEEGEHYNVVDKRVPPVMGFPAIPHLALRFEPDPHLALKLELAYGIVQFWFGLSAHIGFET